MAAPSLGEGGGLGARPLLSVGSEGAPVLKPPEVGDGGPRPVRVSFPGAPATQQRPPGGAPPRGEGHLSHLLYSIALARNDKSRIAALLTLQSNCVSLLPDTQRLHVALTALDAIVCNAVPFTLKTGGPRNSPHSKAFSEAPSTRPASRGARGWFRGAPAAGRGPSRVEERPSGTSPSSRVEADAQGSEEARGASRDATQYPAEAPAAAPAAAEGAADAQHQHVGVVADSLGGPLAGARPPGVPQHPGEGALPLSSESAASSTSGTEAVFSFPASPQGRSSSGRSSGPRNAASGGSPPGASPALKGNNRGPPPQASCWLAVTRPFSVLSRVAAMQVWTSVSVLLDCLLVAPRWLERLVGLLHAFVRNVGAAEDACIRAYACSCLEELEMAYPGLLFPLLGPEGFSSPQAAATFGTLQLGPLRALWGRQELHTISPLFLKDLLEKETKETHFAAEAYASLLLRCCRHLAESVICEVDVAKKSLPRAPSVEGPQEAPPVCVPPWASDVESPEVRQALIPRQQSQLEMTAETRSLVGEGLAARPRGVTEEEPLKSLTSACLGATETAALHYKIPFIGVSIVPLPAVTLTRSSSNRGGLSSSVERKEAYPPPRLGRGLGIFLRAALSLTLERIWRLGDWGQLTVGGQLAFFTRLLCLPASASAALTLPFLFSSRMHLIHSWALLVEAGGDEGGAPLGGRPVSQLPGPYALLLSDRLQELAQDQTLRPYGRTLAIRCLGRPLAFAFRSQSSEAFLTCLADAAVAPMASMVLPVFFCVSAAASPAYGSAAAAAAAVASFFVLAIAVALVCGLRCLSRRWLMALMQHPKFAAAFSNTPPSVFCPSAEDPPSVKEHLLQALLLYCSSSSCSSGSGGCDSSASKGTCANLYDVCGVMYEFVCARRAPEVHAVVFRLLLRSMQRPQLATRQLRDFLCEHLRCRPVELGPSVLLLLHHAAQSLAALPLASRAERASGGRCEHVEIIECLLLPLAEFLEGVEPPEDLLLFSALIFRLSTEPLLPPSCLLRVLRRLANTSAAGDAAHSWRAGLCVLAVAKQEAKLDIAVIAVDTLKLLLVPFANLCHACTQTWPLNAAAGGVAVLLLQLAPAKLLVSCIYSKWTVGVYFRTFLARACSFEGTVPFLSFSKSRRQRQVLCGLKDEQAAFFLTPGGPPQGHEDAPSPGQGPPERLDAAACFRAVYEAVHGEAAIEALAYGGAPPAATGCPGGSLSGPWALCLSSSAVDSYYAFLAAHSFSICLPFRLRVVGAPMGGPCCTPSPQSASRDALGGGPPHTARALPQWTSRLGDLYAIELSFSQCPSYRPLRKVLIPFLQSSIEDALGIVGDALSEEEETVVMQAANSAFPFNYEIILKSLAAGGRATAAAALHGGAAASAADKGCVADGMWTASFMCYCRLTASAGSASRTAAAAAVSRPCRMFVSKQQPQRGLMILSAIVQTLDLEPEKVKQMVEMSLKPFLVEGSISVEPEAFDFHRDQCLHEPEESASAHEGAPLSLSFAVGAPVSPSPPAKRATDESLGEGVPANATWTKKKSEDELGGQRITDVFADDYFDGQIPYSEILAGCTGTPRALMEGGPLSEGASLHLETLHAIVFLPPKYHLLLKFTISIRTTVVRIVTDRPELLAYLDAFFAACYAVTFTAESLAEPTVD
ncbi:hypothetical protein ACSSS7_005938 [Eimeria intestinalis]